MTRVAVVEKAKTNGSLYREIFDFDFDQFNLVNSPYKKIKKADITLDMSELEPYDYVILIGADPAKHIAKTTNVTKYCGHLINDKYIPMLNPAALKFNPGLKNTFNAALVKLKAHISGTYKENLGAYKYLYCAASSL